MFSQSTPLDQLETKISDTEVNLQKSIEETLNSIENELDIHCPISHTLPIIPYKFKSKENKSDDGRAFTQDNFELSELLKHLEQYGNQFNPLTKAPLYLGDIGTNMIPNHELIDQVDALLQKKALQRQDLLKHFGISQELYDHLLKLNLKPSRLKRYVYRIRQIINHLYARLPDEENIQVVVGYIFMLVGVLGLLCILYQGYNHWNSTAVLNYCEHVLNQLFEIISSMPSVLYKIAQATPGFLLDTTMKVIEILRLYLPEIFDFLFIQAPPKITNGMLSHLGTLQNVTHQIITSLPSDYPEFKAVVQETLLPRFESIFTTTLNVGIKTISVFDKTALVRLASGGSLVLAPHEIYRRAQNQDHWLDKSRSRKILFGMSMVCILLLGIDALCDCFNLVNHLIPENNLSSENTSTADSSKKIMCGLMPFALVATVGLFGRINKKTKGEIEFDKFKKNGFNFVQT